MSNPHHPDLITVLAERVAAVPTERGVAAAEQRVIDRKAGQRVVVRIALREPVLLAGGDGIEVDHLYAKVFDDPVRGARVNETLRMLWSNVRAGDASFGLPQPLAFDVDPCVLLLAPVRGVALLDANAGDAAWTRVGRWLGHLHASRAALPVRYDRNAELRTLRGWRADIVVAGAPDELLRQYGAIIDRFDVRTGDVSTAPIGPIHRDLHHEHIIIRRVGDDAAVSVIDLDEARLGDAHVDLGHLLVHLELAGVAPGSFALVIDAWRHRTGRDIENAPMATATALAGLKVARQRACGFGVAPRPIGEARWIEMRRALDVAINALDGVKRSTRPT